MCLRRFLASIVVILMHLPLIACSCILIESFCEAVNRGKEWSPQMTMAIRYVKVKDVPVDDYRTDMIFEITESFYNPMNLKTVRVLDGSGISCTRPVHDYDIGEELVLHLWLFVDSTEILGSISSCQPPPLKVKGDNVTGAISRGVERLSIPQFRKLLHCGFETKTFTIYPIPASESIMLAYNDRFVLSGTNILIVNAMGQHFLSSQIREEDATSMSISVSDLPPGMYYLRAFANEIATDQSFLVVR